MQKMLGGDSGWTSSPMLSLQTRSHGPERWTIFSTTVWSQRQDGNPDQASEHTPLNFIPSPALCEHKTPQKTFSSSGRSTWGIKFLTTRHCTPAHFDSFSHLPAGDCKKLCSHLAGPLAISVGYHCLLSSIKIDSKSELLQISVHRLGLQKHFGAAGFAVTSQRPTVANVISTAMTPEFSTCLEKNVVLLLWIFK